MDPFFLLLGAFLWVQDSPTIFETDIASWKMRSCTTSNKSTIYVYPLENQHIPPWKKENHLQKVPWEGGLLIPRMVYTFKHLLSTLNNCIDWTKLRHFSNPRGRQDSPSVFELPPPKKTDATDDDAI